MMYPAINTNEWPVPAGNFSDNYRITEFAMAYFPEQYVNGNWEAMEKPCRTFQEALAVIREAEGG